LENFCYGFVTNHLSVTLVESLLFPILAAISDSRHEMASAKVSNGIAVSGIMENPYFDWELTVFLYNKLSYYYFLFVTASVHFQHKMASAKVAFSCFSQE
jgi:hypothetical protein